jgi:flagellar hook protein FlgE
LDYYALTTPKPDPFNLAENLMGLRALFNSISGLQSDSQWLDVIGNNISNTNTVAYKASRVEFADQFSQTLFGGSGDNPSTGTGGIDPQQVGLGTRLASIDTIFTQGATQNTGIATDISIQGSGFLITKQGGQNLLTRAGNLTFDSLGYLVDQNGGRIQGLNADLQFNKQIINSFSNIPGQPLVITSAGLQLNQANVSGLQDIQINRDLTIAPKATSLVKFQGNLDSFQQPNVLNLFPPGGPVLPVGLMLAQIPPPAGIDTTRMTTVPLPGGGFALQQVSDLASPLAGTHIPVPLDNGIITLNDVAANDTGNYAWEQQPPLPPASTATETVFDSLGNPRQITVQFYQVNDLGANGVNNPAGPNQAVYAWYAFDTSGGKAVSTANLLGGTGIWEGDMLNPPFDFGGYDQGIPLAAFAGDFLWFNTDGSLASSGGIAGPPAPPGVPNFMDLPTLYLPPTNGFLPTSPIPTQGAEITAVRLDFGTFGVMGFGKRDGVYSDAEGSYQPINGVNTYVPKSTVFAASQNGYPDGSLQGLNFDPSGIIKGTFTNGQTLDLAQVVLAQPQNPDGLSKTGSNDFTPSTNTGPIQNGLAGQGSFGKILGDSLEGSNVDLTVELSNMIVAQRGFATNSRMIAAVNETMNTIAHLGQ